MKAGSVLSKAAPAIVAVLVTVSLMRFVSPVRRLAVGGDEGMKDLVRQAYRKYAGRAPSETGELPNWIKTREFAEGNIHGIAFSLARTFKKTYAGL